MKANNPTTTFKEAPKSIYIILAACALLNFIVLILNGGANIYYDSPSYINAWENYSHFDIDVARTPGYPVFIGLCKVIFGEALAMNAIVVVQIIVYLISVWYFYKSSLLLSTPKTIALCVTFIYAFLPESFDSNTCIMTESLGMSGIVFLTYFTLKTVICQSAKYQALMCITLFLLLFYRPAFLFLIPIYLVGWAIFFFTRKNRRKLYGAGLAAVTLITLSVVGYACAFKAKYEVFNISYISIINNYYVCRQYGILDADATNNPKLKEAIIHFNIKNGSTVDVSNDYLFSELWKELHYLFDSNEFTLKDLNEVVSNSMKAHKDVVAKSIVKRLVDGQRLYIWLATINVYLWVLVVIFCYIAYSAIKQKRIPMISCYLMFSFVGLFVVSILGAQNFWHRLTLPAFSCWLLLVGHFLPLFRRNYKHELI